MKIATLTFAAALAVSGAACAASPFVGSWTSDVAKSTFTGDTMTFTQTPTGYHFVNGAVAYDFADDAKPYPTVASRTVTWSKTGNGVWDIVYDSNGKLLTKAHRVLSPDGSTLTTSYEEHRADGTVVHESDVYTRVNGGPGLVGTWKSTKVEAATHPLLISQAGSGAYRLEYPMNKAALTTHLDGKPTPVSGPNVPPGANATFKQVDDHQWTYIDRLGDKEMGQGVMTVSSDGSTLTDTNWAPGKEDEKSVEVYDRR